MYNDYGEHKMRTIKIIIIIFAVIFGFLMSGCRKDNNTYGKHLDIVTVKEILAKNSTAISRKDKHGFTMLHNAVRSGQLDVVKLLIERGANVNERVLNPFGSTALMFAAIRGFNEILLYLIEKGADINAVAGEGKIARTALTMSAWNNHIEILEMLLKHGAKVNLKVENKTFISPLIWPAYWGRTEIVEILLRHGANVNGDDNTGSTALFYAVMNEQKRLVKLLLDHESNVNHVNKVGNTPLHMISHWRKRLIHQKEIVSMLVEKGAKVNVQNSNLSTPLHNAVFNRLSDIVTLLLKHGAETHYLNDMKQTALFVAGNRGATLAIQKILALHKAVIDNNPRKVSSLLKQYPQLLNTRDFDYKTPLHIATEKNDLKYAQLLIAAGAQMNAVSRFKSIPLIHGVVAKILVPKIGRVKRQKYKKTPLAIATQKGFAQMAQLLKSHGANE
jgi:ankyrin repeat protein